MFGPALSLTHVTEFSLYFSMTKDCTKKRSFLCVILVDFESVTDRAGAYAYARIKVNK